MSLKRDLMLLVEDTAEDELAFLKIFKQSHFDLELKILRDGAEAMDYFFSERASENPVPLLVLMDMHLPKAHGLEVLKALKTDERTKALPVAMMSSTQTRLLVEESRRLGAAACLTKPLDRKGLQVLIVNARQSNDLSRQVSVADGQ